MKILPMMLNATHSAQFPHAALDLIVIAASAGGIPALGSILAKLPGHFPVPLAVVQHLSPLAPSRLAEVLGYRARLPVAFARHGERLAAGKVFVAPPDRHLVIDEHRRLALENSPRIAYTRPAADRLFESAALAFGSRVLGLVLSGMGRDGTEGARAVHQRGGIVIVQDPGSAEAPSMPEATLNSCPVDLVLPPAGIASALVTLAEVFGARELFCGGTPNWAHAA